MAKPKPHKPTASDRERAREREQERHRVEPEPQADGAPEPDAEAVERERHFVPRTGGERERERLIDEGSEESFPASDPPARTSLGSAGTEPVAPAGEPRIEWLRDVEQGFAEARAKGLPVLLDFSAAPT